MKKGEISKESWERSQMIHEHQCVTVLPNGQLHVETINTEPTMARQEFKDECDINNIVKKYQQTGEFSHISSAVGKYGDFSDVADYQTALHQVMDAQNSFNQLPAQLRKRFDNDPAQLIDFLSNESNYDEALKLGLVNERAKPNPINNDLNNEKTTQTASGKKTTKNAESSQGSTD